MPILLYLSRVKKRDVQKTILITGSTDGIGLEAAKTLCSLGHHVLLHGRKPEKLEAAEKTLSELSGGGRVESYLADLSRMVDVDAFAELRRDTNPIRFSREFVQLKGFRSRICHGLLVGGMLTEAGGQIGWLASGMNFRFKKPVYFGDTITCRFTLTSVDANLRATAEAVFTNHDGVVVLEADLYGVLPSAKERAVLATLLEGNE